MSRQTTKLQKKQNPHRIVP